jgi:hypothetical protein
MSSSLGDVNDSDTCNYQVAPQTNQRENTESIQRLCSSPQPCRAVDPPAMCFSSAVGPSQLRLTEVNAHALGLTGDDKNLFWRTDK